MATIKLRERGSGYWLTISRKEMGAMDLKLGDPVDIKVTRGKIIVRPIKVQ